MRNSKVYSPRNPSTYAFALITLFAVSNIPRTATASPVPVTRRTPFPFFLDFLYPEWYTTKTLSTPSSAGDKERKERLRSAITLPPPGSSKPASGARVLWSLDTPQRPRASQQQPQLQRQRQRRRQLFTPTRVSPPLAKRTTANGNLVPVKYASIDQAGGWVIDDTWDLHGHHRRTTDASTNDTLPVQNLDTTDNNNTTTIDTIDPTDDTDGLDLPFGWQEGGLNPRHESYDPVIVAVFAVILVLCIVATIGLCRWRARKLRRLRDLEKLEREKDGGGGPGGDDDNSIGDGSSDSGRSRLSEKKKRKFIIGSAGASSSAIRKRFARFRRRHRVRRNAEEKTSDVEEEQSLNDRVDERTLRGDHSSAPSIASSTTTTTLSKSSRSLTSHRSRSSATLENATNTPAITPASTPASTDLTIPITINGIPIHPPINGLHPNPNSADPAVPTGQNQLSIGAASERGRRSGRGGEHRPRITVTSSEITPTTTFTLDPTMATMDMEAPNAEPPAYPAGTSISSTDGNGNGNPSTRRTRRTRTSTPHLHLPLPPEKAPIPGLEAEYDDRDFLARGYTPNSGSLLTPYSGLFNSRLSTSPSSTRTGTGLSPRSSAPPTRRPSRVRFADDYAGERGVQDGGENDAHATDPGEEEEEQVPSFEPFASSVGTSLEASRAAAGATLRAHVATDDKGLLERLINVSSEPPLSPPPPLSTPPPPITGDGLSSHLDGLSRPRPRPPLAAITAIVAIVAAAPSFSEIDQWELERQMAQAHGSGSPTTDAELSSSSLFAIQPTLAGSSAFGSSSRRVGTSSNGFPALPAPPLPMFSAGGGGGGGGSGDVGYGLGTVWNSLNVGAGIPSMPPPPRSSTSASGNGKARVPPAPPLAPPASSLHPSAPMLDEDMGANGQVMPSAPPAWDDDEEDEVHGGPILQLGTSSMEGHAPDAPGMDESRIAHHHQPNTLPLQDNEGDAGSDGDGDGDGAESIINTPPDNEEANSRWSATFQTRPEEGAGLPRYEP